MPEPEIEYGYGYGQQFEVCAHVVGAERMVCGRKVGRIMVSIEEAPSYLHARCRELLDAGLAVRPSLCQVCEQPVRVESGRVQPHGGCVGTNLPPKRGQS